MVTVIVPDLPAIEVDEEVIAAWIEKRLEDAQNLFLRNLNRGRGGGKVYRRGRRRHFASAPGEYPVTDGGRLSGSVHPELVSNREGILWSDVKYSKWLTEGSKYMEPRKMFAEAIKETLADRPETDELAKAARIK